MGALQVPEPCHRLYLLLRVKPRIYLPPIRYPPTAEGPKPCSLLFLDRFPRRRSQAALRSPLTCLRRAASPASERRPWNASLAAAASSSSPWSDLYGPVSTCTLPTKPYKACCHSPLGLFAEPALLFSTSCCLHQLVVCQGLRGGGIEPSKANRIDKMGWRGAIFAAAACHSRRISMRVSKVGEKDSKD